MLVGFQGIYTTSHYVENKFKEIDQETVFAKLKNKLDGNNLCNYLDLFPDESIYYGIDFSKEECESISNQVMTKGFRSTFVYYVDSGIELISRNMNP